LSCWEGILIARIREEIAVIAEVKINAAVIPKMSVTIPEIMAPTA
jgi:hypothetical protein